MSIRASNWAWNLLAEADLSDGQKLILLRLADHADTEGLCWPGNASIATTLGCSERTVERAKQRLSDLGLVATEIRLRDNGKGRMTDTIQLLIDQPDTGVGMGQDQPDTRDVTNPTLQTDQPDTRDAASVLREPPGNHQENQRARDDKRKIDGLIVTPQEWQQATLALDAFNKENGGRLRPLDQKGEPSKHIRPIIQRIREYPEHADGLPKIVERNFANPWWGKNGASTVNVLFNEGQFPKAVHNDGRPTGRRTFKGERRSDPSKPQPF